MNPGLEEKGLQPGVSIAVGSASVAAETIKPEEKPKVSKIDDTAVEQPKRETIKLRLLQTILLIPFSREILFLVF